MQRGHRLDRAITSHWAAIAVLMAAAAWTDSSDAADTKYNPIGEEAAKIVFFAPGVASLSVQRYERTLRNGTIKQEFAQWQRLGYGYTTGVFLTELIGGYHSNVKQELLELTRSWKFWKNREIDVLASGSTGNRLDRVEYKIATSGSLSCVIFLTYFGDATTHDRQSFGTAFVSGYHCMPDVKPLSKADAERIVKLLGVKGHGVPDKPRDWDAQEAKAAKPPRPSTGAAATDRPQQDSEASLRSVPLAARWEGRYELAAGQLFYDPQGPTGRIQLRLPDGADCNGTWRWSSGKYGTSELPKGVWSVACSDGSTASGNYVSDKPGSGTGEGQDGQGRKIKLTYGG